MQMKGGVEDEEAGVSLVPSAPPAHVSLSALLEGEGDLLSLEPPVWVPDSHACACTRCKQPFRQAPCSQRPLHFNAPCGSPTATPAPAPAASCPSGKLHAHSPCNSMHRVGTRQPRQSLLPLHAAFPVCLPNAPCYGLAICAGGVPCLAV